MVTAVVAVVAAVAMVAAGVVAYFLTLEEHETVAAEGTRLARIDRLVPWVGLAVAALLFGLVAVVVLVR